MLKAVCENHPKLNASNIEPLALDCGCILTPNRGLAHLRQCALCAAVWIDDPEAKQAVEAAIAKSEMIKEEP